MGIIDELTKIETLARMLRARYGKQLAEVTHQPQKSFVIYHKDITDKEISDAVITKRTTADSYIRQALILNGVPENVVEKLSIRYLRIPSYTPIRALTSDYITQMRSFEGIIRKVSEVKPKLTIASFKCSNCGIHYTIEQRGDELEYPDRKCEACDKSVRWVLDPTKCKYIDSQTIVVQEYPEGLKGGEQPLSVTVELTSDLCKTTIPGQRVLICGLVKAREVKRRDLKLELYTDGNSIEQKDELYEDLVISPEEFNEIEKLSKQPDLLIRFIKSVAPTIYGHENIKKGIVLQLFGGVSKAGQRGDIHILLIGDPGLAKSVILKQVATLSPRGIFTHGNASTKAGLTATAVKEGDTWALEAGALVLADKGLCCVDELDKMNDQDRGALHGAMEQQEIDVAKAGIVAKLLCRCSLLAAANPKHGRFDQYISIPEQFNLPPTLVSRFDLIFTLLDVKDVSADEVLVDYITDGRSKDGTPAISVDILRKYIAYAKENFSPTLSDDAKKVIKDYYVSVRSKSSGTVPITPRSLEGLMRLSEAAARMRFSNIVTKDDATVAVSVMDGCLRDIAYDSKTKTWDIDRVVCKYPKSTRDVIDKITISIHNLEDVYKVAKVADVVVEMNKRYGIDEREVLTIIDFMRDQHMIIMPRTGLVKII